MKKEEMMHNLVRYGKIKNDFECKDGFGNWFRFRVIEYKDTNYFTVMCNGEVLRCEEI